MEEIIKGIKSCASFYDFLVYVRDTDGLTMIDDNGWSWLEYNGKEVPGTAKERFTNSSEIHALMNLAGL